MKTFIKVILVLLASPFIFILLPMFWIYFLANNTKLMDGLEEGLVLFGAIGAEIFYLLLLGLIVSVLQAGAV